MKGDTQIENAIAGSGDGADTFIFTKGHDTILDFKTSEDKVNISTWGFGDLFIKKIGVQTLIEFENGSLTFGQLDATSPSTDDFFDEVTHLI